MNSEQKEPIPIKFLDHDPDPSTLYFEDRLTDESSEQEDASQRIETVHKTSLSDDTFEAAVTAVNLVVGHKHDGFFIRKAKVVGVVGLAAAVGIAGFQVKNWIEDIGDLFSGESSHSVDLSIDAPETEIFEDVYLNLARVDSTFAVTLATSLDRPGPFNCDTETKHTGKKNEDDKITTKTNAGIIVDMLSVTRSGDSVSVDVEGDLTMSEPAVDYKKNEIKVQGSSGGVDVCIGTNEITKARGIVDVAVQEAARVSTSCALQDEAGEEVFKKGVKAFISNTSLAQELSPDEIDNMEVNISDYKKSADAMYGVSAQEFRQVVGDKIADYLDETEKHKDPQFNNRDLLDCRKHNITFSSDEEQ